MREEDYLRELVDFLSINSWTGSAMTKLKPFDGAVPYFGPFVELYNTLTNGGHGVYLNADPDATGRVADLTLLRGLNSSEQSREETKQFAPSRIRFVTKTKVSQTTAFIDPRTMTVRVKKEKGCIVGGIPKLLKHRGRSLSSWNSGASAVEVIRNGNTWKGAERDFISAVRLTPGLYFNLYHCWSVYFRAPGSLAVRFPVDPRIALEIFRDREKDPGKVRRDALLHWVKKYLRRKPNQENACIEVRRHIRGRKQFFWHGFECVIEPDKDYVSSIMRE